MQKLTMARLEQILTKELSLESPEFRLERWKERLNGSVISDTFKGKRDHQRQVMIWDALDAALGKESVLLVGMLLAYTRDEWFIDGPPPAQKPKVKKAKPAHVQLAGSH